MPSKPMTDAEIARACLDRISGTAYEKANPIPIEAIDWLSDFAEGRAIKCGAEPRAWENPDNPLEISLTCRVHWTPLYAPQEKSGE